MMSTIKTQNEKVTDYNQAVEATLTKAITYGSMQRPRATLASIAGIKATNDNKRD